MLLEESSSLCGKRQKIIVSAEKGKQHRAYNTDGASLVRQYRLDGGVVRQEKCCDFLVLNDSSKDAYFIELKGVNVSEAADQLRAAVNIVKGEIKGYRQFLRIVCSKVVTHEVNSYKIRKLKEDFKGRVVIAVKLMEDEI